MSDAIECISLKTGEVTLEVPGEYAIPVPEGKSKEVRAMNRAARLKMAKLAMAAAKRKKAAENG